MYVWCVWFGSEAADRMMDRDVCILESLSVSVTEDYIEDKLVEKNA